MRKHSHSSEGSPLRCYENRFCSSLDPDTRRRLCQACTKPTYAANSKATMNFYRHFLVVEGLCLAKRFRTSFVYRQGDFVVNPITVQDKPPMNFGGEHSAHCLRYGQAPRGRRSGASGWPSAPAPKRARGVLPPEALAAPNDW